MDINLVLRLYNHFTNSGWNTKDGHKSIFESLCLLINNFSHKEQQVLLVELIERYTWITFSEYQALLRNLANQIAEKGMDGIKKIILFPIMNPEDESRTKSGHALAYNLEPILKAHENYRDIFIYRIEAFEEVVNEEFCIPADTLFFIVDDYIGSGETLENTVNYILQNKNVKSNQIRTLSIAAQEVAINFLNNLNIPHYVDKILKKGIHDFYAEDIIDEKIKIMESIEKRIYKLGKYSFGYNQTEALITVAKTPNNTFPIFWKHYKISNGEKLNPTFIR